MTTLARHRRLITLVTLTCAALLIGYATLASPPEEQPQPTNPAVNIDVLLPMTRAELATAAQTARQFVAAYGTYRYDESPQTYLARIEALATDDLYQRLQRAAQDPAILQARQRDQMVVTAEATITATRDLQPTSVILQVTGRQHITRAGQTTQSSQDFAVTLTKQGGSWQVTELSLASTGQNGDAPP